MSNIDMITKEIIQQKSPSSSKAFVIMAAILDDKNDDAPFFSNSSISFIFHSSFSIFNQVNAND